MKRIILIFCISTLCFPTFAQILTRISKDRVPLFTSKSISTPLIVKLPKLDVDELRRKDKEEQTKGLEYLPRFGKDIDVNYSLENSGRWEDIENGRVWKLEVFSEGAISLNMIFDKFYMSEGSEFFIYNKKRTMVIGPITSKVNNERRTFATDIVKGESVILELYEPKGVAPSELRISKVIHGYLNVFNNNFPGVTPGYGASAPCHNDINCPIGLPWEEEANSVAMILLANNTRVCSGALLNNLCEDFTPYFLTAFHCVDGNLDGVLQAGEIAAAENWVFRFQYKSPSCDGPDDFSYYSFNGANFRAAWQTSDFALFELDQRPTDGVEITYAGWSRVNTSPTSSAGIHHPNGDVMKISTESSSATSVGWPGGPANTHWRVSFDNGIVQHGSSGSPLFNPEGRIVGQLHGNQNYSSLLSYCSQPIGEYGRFDVSWGMDAAGNFLPGRNVTNSIGPWLDPDNNGATTMNSATIPPITGPDFLCNSEIYTITNLPTGATVTGWSASPSGAVTISGSGNSRTVTRNPAYNGPVALTATIATTCGSLTIERELYAGLATGHFIDGPTSLSPGSMGLYYAENTIPPSPMGVTTWNWFLSPPPASYTITPVADGVAQVRIWTPGTYLLALSVVNPCGTAAAVTLPITVSSGGGAGGRFTVFPNPADETLTVSFRDDSIDTKSNDIFISTTFTTILFDGSGREQRRGESNDGKIQFETAGLPEGTYFVHIHNGGEVEKRQVVIRH